MFGIMLQKLWHKKWMNFCLLLGSVLMIATVASFPLYQTAAYDRMLRDEFRGALASEGRWPAILKMLVVSKKDPGGSMIASMEGLMENLGADLGVTPRERVYYYLHTSEKAHSAMNRTDLSEISLRLGMLSALPEHAKMISGEMYSGTGLAEDGSIEVVISQSALINLRLLVGETLNLDFMKDAEGNGLRLRITGVFGVEDTGDFYWQFNPDDMNNVCLMEENLFRRMFTGENAEAYNIVCNYVYLFEYADLRADRADRLAERTDYLTGESAYRNTLSEPAYRTLLDSFFAKRDRIRATLLILQVPVLVMLGAFLAVLSGQMYELERNEISVIKSRGGSGLQIFGIYLYQSIFLTLAGAVFGIPLGAVFSRILGSAKSFLEFDESRSLEIVFTEEVWYYVGTAMAVSLLVMALPAVRHSRVTIVGLKRQKALKKKSWWEKIFLDFILIGVSLYGYYSFRRNAGNLAESVMAGRTLDPLLYISSSLFIVGLGLLFLRLQPLAVQLIYVAGRRFWGPASYASFVENLKNGRKQQFVMLFLIMTVSLGIYHSTVARTILQNTLENTEYLDGADIVIREVWKTVTDENGAPTGEYREPNYGKYAGMECAAGYTRVLRDTGASVGTGGKNRQSVTLMGIHTKEFGELTQLADGLQEKSYHRYLNELAVSENGILVSGNFQSKLGYSAGDTLWYQSGKNSASGVILDFFDYWPGYMPSVTELNPDGSAQITDNFLIVTHYDFLRQKWGVRPYEVWVSLKEDCDPQGVYDWIGENRLQVRKFVDRGKDLKYATEDPLLQGTNGVLTMGFLVTILLCAVGYLIYWVMSIRSRELVFGVLRACGMHRGELFHMLMNEQIFCGVFSVLAGVGIGRLASGMFVPMLQQAYAAANQVLPIRLIVNPADMIRLYVVIAGVMAVCLLVLILLLFKMNVARALKLGEE